MSTSINAIATAPPTAIPAIAPAVSLLGLSGIGTGDVVVVDDDVGVDNVAGGLASDEEVVVDTGSGGVGKSDRSVACQRISIIGTDEPPLIA